MEKLGGKGKILVVDDSLASIDMAQTALENEGYQIVAATSGEKAIRLAEMTSPDLILLDVLMPEMDGFETCRRLKAMEKTRDIPVVFMTGLTSSENKVEGFEAGGVDYVTKPMAIEVFLARIKNHLALRAAHGQLKNRNERLRQEIAERKRIEEKVRDLNTNLERRCEERTMELALTNRHLRAEIAERKQAEEALKNEKTFIDNALDAMSDAFMVVGLDGRLARWNKVVGDLAGRNDKEVSAMLFTDFIGDMDRQRAKNAFQAVIQKGKASLEALVVDKEGEMIPFEFTGTLLTDADGRPSNVCIVGRDITERKNLEEQLRQAVKMEAVGVLAGGVAHDFNNLMSAVLGYSELLLMRIPDDPKLRRDAMQIRSAGERAASLTAQLLAFSRKQVVRPAILDLNHTVANTEKLLRRLIGEDIDLACNLDPDLSRIMADPSLIDQIIMNLAINSRDAMPYGGKLTIETANVFLDESYVRCHIGVEIGHYVMLAVSDSGCGMDQETVSRIFEPFFTTKGEGKGTGLGLATVYGNVKQSGGIIRVYSEPGQGTTFKIYLPRADEDAETNNPDIVAAEALPKGTETILLVEDDENVRQIARSILVACGYTVLESEGGEEALGLCKTLGDSIDLLITDVVMPGMNGRKLAQRAEEFCPSAKVLYMSGYTDNAIVHHGVLDEGIAFLQKPFTLKSLSLKVREVLDGTDGKNPHGD